MEGEGEGDDTVDFLGRVVGPLNEVFAVAIIVRVFFVETCDPSEQ